MRKKTGFFMGAAATIALGALGATAFGPAALGQNAAGPFTAAQVKAFRSGEGDVVVGFDHANYGHMAVMPAAVREALGKDFA